ncbi:leucine-rich repeat domain-containing protein [Flavobacterium okayamense]|uniref:T9SS C-terminal target domain-containing protein n=1 Tax=Flavobacterium okayamense TaxID=2830782 RepID=A0ABN6HX29_9FLAO|nr:leucine-rich repeat domain-containing protein [Flavobacterium okayamense]BCY28935.1 T9SS C-terminal target domain-containing protein [Flavobacterium okayamense]
MKKHLLLFSILFCSLLGYSQTFTDNYITYDVVNSTSVVISDYDANGGTVVNIPATVSYNGTTYNVTSIGNSAFLSNSLTNVTIPSSVTSIGNNAFRNNNLVSVTIPDSVISIGVASFAYNSLMINVQLSNNLTSIPTDAFSFNDLQSLVIPENVTSIGELAFVSNGITSLVIGNNVISIGNSAFRDNNISNLVIPSSVNNIGDSAFLFNPLSNVYSENGVPPIIITSSINDTFAFNRSTIHLHIPPGTTGAYVTNSGALWTGFAPVTEDALSTSNFELENDIKIISMENSIKILSSNQIQLENYSLFNLSGQEISKGVESEIPTISFSKGVYILVLNFDKGSVTKKVLIK